MNIWVIEIGEVLPTESGERMLRAGMLCKELVAQGHNVNWWTSTFCHATKKLRFQADADIEIKSNYTIKCIHGGEYKKNVSFARLIHHHKVARRFSVAAQAADLPDVIFCCYPTISLCKAAIKFGKRHNIPVIVDIRDYWPDYFLHVVPSSLHFFAKASLYSLFRDSKYVFKKADAIVGITPQFLSWALKRGKRKQRDNDRVFYLGFPEKMDVDYDVGKSFWDTNYPGLFKNNFVITYFGVIKQVFDMQTIYLAAQELKKRGRNDIKFLICGSGGEKERFQELSKYLDNIIFAGWRNKHEVYYANHNSETGLLPLLNVDNFTQNYPNKIFEYFSAGIPVLSSIEGIMSELLEDNDCGRTYPVGDGCALVDSVLELYSDFDLRKAMGERGKQLFLQRFSAETIYPKLAKYISSFSEKL